MKKLLVILSIVSSALGATFGPNPQFDLNTRILYPTNLDLYVAPRNSTNDVRLLRDWLTNLFSLNSNQFSFDGDLLSKGIKFGAPVTNLTIYGGSNIIKAELSTVFRPIESHLIDLGVNVKNFGALCDGETDDTDAILRAYNAVKTNGGTIRIPARTRFNQLWITNDNITLIGGGHIMDYTSAATNRSWMPISTNAMIRVGDGINKVKGFVLRDASLYSDNYGGEGLWLNSCQEAIIDHVVIWNFDFCVKALPTGAQPSTLVDYIAFDAQGTTNTGARTLYFKGVDNFADLYTTAHTFYGGHINGVSTGTNAKTVEIDGTTVSFIGTYFDMNSGGDHSILITKTEANTSRPYMVSQGAYLDAGGGIVVEIDPTVTGGGSTYPHQWVRGYVITSGLIKMQDGSTYSLKELSGSSSRFYQPIFDDGILFNYDSNFGPPADSAKIHVNSAGKLIIQATNGLALDTRGSPLTMQVGDSTFGGSITLTNGGILLDNNKSIFAKNTTGSYESVLSPYGTANNVFLSGSSVGGSVIIQTRNTTNGMVQFLLGGTERWRFDYLGDFLPQTTNNIAASSKRAGTGYFTNLDLPGGNVQTNLDSKQNIFTTTYGLTNLNNVLLPLLSSGTNIVLTTNGNTIVINTAITTTNVIVIACSDTTTTITSGIKKQYFRVPKSCSILGVKATLLTASSGDDVIVDINKNGTSILSTKLTIDTGEKTSVTATTPAVISSASLTADDEITFDFDQAGTGAVGVQVTIFTDN